MPLLKLNLTPSLKDLRWFAALCWPALCAGIGAVLVRKFHSPRAAIWMCAAGAALAVVGFIAPSVIRPFYLALNRLTYPIGWCVSHVALAAMYFLILTPIGCLVRLFHDPMERRFEREANSYWVPRGTISTACYFRQL